MARDMWAIWMSGKEREKKTVKIKPWHPARTITKGTSGSIYSTLGRRGRGSLKGLLKFLEGKKFNTCSLLSTYFLTSKCHIQPDFDDGAPLNLQTHSQVTYVSSGLIKKQAGLLILILFLKPIHSLFYLPVC